MGWHISDPRLASLLALKLQPLWFATMERDKVGFSLATSGRLTLRCRGINLIREEAVNKFGLQ
jgi:hypothetical protein